MALRRTVLHMTIDGKLKAKLLSLAALENRTLSNLVETALFALVRSKGEKK